MKSLIINISLLRYIDFDIPLLEDIEESSEKGFELFSVDSLIAINVEQVKEVFYVILSGLLSAHKINEGLDYLGKLAFGESVVLVLIEFIEYLVENGWDVLFSQFALSHQ